MADNYVELASMNNYPNYVDMSSMNAPYSGWSAPDWSQMDDGSVAYNGYIISPSGQVTPQQNDAWWNNISPGTASLLSGLGGAALNYFGQQQMLNAANKGQSYLGDALGQQNALTQQQVANFAPYVGLGTQGVADLQQFDNPNYSFLGSPSGRYMFEQGNKALQRSLANRGLLGSGQAATAQADLAQKVGATDYETAYNRALNKVKIGQGAAGSTNASLGQMGGFYGTYGANAATQSNNQGQAKAGLYATPILGAQLGTAVYDWLRR